MLSLRNVPRVTLVVLLFFIHAIVKEKKGKEMRGAGLLFLLQWAGAAVGKEGRERVQCPQENEYETEAECRGERTGSALRE